jgi:hypothetical protein
VATLRERFSIPLQLVLVGFQIDDACAIIPFHMLLYPFPAFGLKPKLPLAQIYRVCTAPREEFSITDYMRGDERSEEERLALPQVKFHS